MIKNKYCNLVNVIFSAKYIVSKKKKNVSDKRYAIDIKLILVCYFGVYTFYTDYDVLI